MERNDTLGFDKISKRPIVVIGGGSIGRRHLTNLHKLGLKNLFCLKRQPDSNFENEFKAKVITTKQELKNLNPWAAFVCTPTSRHIPDFELGQECGAHIFMEKPLAHERSSLQQAEGMLNKYNKVFFIGFMLRYHPLVNRMKKLIDQEVLGKVLTARFSFGSYLPYWHPWEDYRQSYAARPELGGGVINTISHEIDLIQYFFGIPQNLVANKRNLLALNIAVEEVADAIFNYEDKVVTLHLDYLQKDYQRVIELFCERGRIKWHWYDNAIFIEDHKSKSRKIEGDTGFDVNQLYVDEIKHFLMLAEEQVTDHPLDLRHAIANTKFMLAIHESADKGRKVTCYA